MESSISLVDHNMICPVLQRGKPWTKLVVVPLGVKNLHHNGCVVAEIKEVQGGPV